MQDFRCFYFPLDLCLICSHSYNGSLLKDYRVCQGPSHTEREPDSDPRYICIPCWSSSNWCDKCENSPALAGGTEVMTPAFRRGLEGLKSGRGHTTSAPGTSPVMPIACAPGFLGTPSGSEVTAPGTSVAARIRKK